MSFWGTNAFFAGVMLLNAPVGMARTGQEGHGGDALAAEFVATGWQVEQYLEGSTDLGADFTAGDLLAFQDALRATRVDTVTFELEDSIGDRVDARVIRDPLRKGTRAAPRYVIQINRDAFYRWVKKGAALHRLVFHEYLWVMGKDDENYRISGKMHEPESFVGLGISPEMKETICHANRGWRGGW